MKPLTKSDAAADMEDLYDGISKIQSLPIRYYEAVRPCQRSDLRSIVVDCTNDFSDGKMSRCGQLEFKIQNL